MTTTTTTTANTTTANTSTANTTTTIMDEASSQHLKLFIRNLFVFRTQNTQDIILFLILANLFLIFRVEIIWYIHEDSNASRASRGSRSWLFRIYPSVIFWSKYLRLCYISLSSSRLWCGTRAWEVHFDGTCFVTFSRRVVLFSLSPNYLLALC